MQMTFHLMMKTFPEIPGEGQSRIHSISNISGFDLPITENDLNHLVQIIEKFHGVSIREIEVVFVDEDEIVRINKEYLNRDYITDIISFNYNETDQADIEGTLFCCAQRIAEQSSLFNSDLRSEFLRVIIHGILHLIGYDDQTKKEKEMMTQRENEILELIKSDIH